MRACLDRCRKDTHGVELCVTNVCIALRRSVKNGAIHNICWTSIATDKVSARHILCAVQSRMKPHESLGLALLHLQSFSGIYSYKFLKVVTEIDELQELFAPGAVQRT